MVLSKEDLKNFRVQRFVITRTKSNWSDATGVATYLTEIGRYTVPRGVHLILFDKDWFHMTVKDDSTTPVALTSGDYEIVHADPSESEFKTIEQGDLSVMQGSLYDEQQRPKYSQDHLLLSDSILIIKVNHPTLNPKGENSTFQLRAAILSPKNAMGV